MYGDPLHSFNFHLIIKFELWNKFVSLEEDSVLIFSWSVLVATVHGSLEGGFSRLQPIYHRWAQISCYWDQGMVKILLLDIRFWKNMSLHY